MSEPLYPASRHDRPHARIYDHHVSHPSWKSLSGNAVKLLVTLLAKYRPNAPNAFPAGGKSIGELIEVSSKTATGIVDELIEAGHLNEERRGRNSGVVKTRERVVSLSRYDTDTRAGDPDLPEKRWRERHRNG